ncbi:hypothetical protein DL770_008086 [Monosporascus sp. CRB-9-2]|nr:hypothetical protein DL770_008086 [Monosporascus sp. CRB-9-2]
MGLSSEAIITIIGVLIALPPTALILWNCLRVRRLHRRQEVAQAPLLLNGYVLRGRIDLYLEREDPGRRF